MSHSDTEHIAERALTLSVIAPAALDAAECDHLKQHLAGCELCRERLAVIETFHADFTKSVGDGPTDRDKAVARGLASEERARWLALPEHTFSGVRDQNALVKRRRAFVEIVDPLHNEFVGRVLEHFRIHPVQAVAGGMVFVAAIVALSLFVVSGPADTNPVRFFVKDRLLSVLNREGRVLWTRHVPGASDGADEEFNGPTQPDNRLIGIGDIDGKGMNVVLDSRDFVICSGYASLH